jgi:hypothetical protein
MSSPFPNSNPLLFETEICGGSHEYRLEVREASTGSRYLRMVDVRRARRDEEERRGVFIFEEHAPDLCWALTRAMAVLGDPHIIDASMDEPNREPRRMDTRSMCSRAYEPWTETEDARLRLAYEQGQSVRSVAAMLGRQERDIESRLRKLQMK